jgi:hypothetical protein
VWIVFHLSFNSCYHSWSGCYHSWNGCYHSWNGCYHSGNVSYHFWNTPYHSQNNSCIQALRPHSFFHMSSARRSGNVIRKVLPSFSLLWTETDPL